MTYTSKLNQKEKLTHTRFKPSVYCVLYPGESVFYTTRAIVPDVISEALSDLFGGTRLDKLPLTGKDFCSLRQLYYNKIYEGRLFRRPVNDTHSVDFVHVHEHVPSGCYSLNFNFYVFYKVEIFFIDSKSEMIVDEDLPWKIRKGKYYRKHFCPERDPVITKFAVSVRF